MFLHRYPKNKSSLSVFNPKGNAKSLQRIMSSKGIMLPSIEIDKSKNNALCIDTTKQPLVDMEFETYNNSPMNQNENSNDLQLPEVKFLPKTLDENFIKILIENVNVCFQMCDFSNPLKDLKAKEIKERLLLDISNVPFGALANFDQNDYIKSLILKMCLKNLTRKVAPYDFEFFKNSDEISIKNNDWVHVQYVYKILISLFRAFPKYKGFNEKLIFNTFIPLISSKDQQERDQLVVFIGTYFICSPQNFSKFFDIATHKIISHLQGNIDPCGIYTSLLLLKLLSGGIPKAFEMLKTILRTHIIPLIRDDYLFIFQTPLLLLLKLVAVNLTALVENILKAIISFWPISHPRKEEILLKYLDKLLEYYPNSNYKLNSRIVEIFAKCCNSEKYKIAELTCHIVQTQTVVELISTDALKHMSLIVPSLEQAKYHWSSCVRETADYAYKSILRINPKLARLCCQNDSQNYELTSNWIMIARKASHRDKKLNLTEKLLEIKKEIGSVMPQSKSIVQSPAQQGIIMKPKVILSSHI